MPSVEMCFDDPLLLKLLQAIKAQYALDWQGIHGISHWARVWENGMRLAEETGANKEVVGYFALFHDARRFNEGRDRDHGCRGAELAAQWRGELFDLDDEAFELFYTACVHHTDGLVDGDVSVQTCAGMLIGLIWGVWGLSQPLIVCVRKQPGRQLSGQQTVLDDFTFLKICVGFGNKRMLRLRSLCRSPACLLS
jgi:hypothetical protein